LLSPGDHVIAMNDLYGGTVRLFNEIKTLSQGIEVTYVDMTDMQNVIEAKTDKTKMIFVETPTNPLLRVVDLEAIADFAKAENILSVCDNTFASPYVQQPLNHGIDIVLHSATKYLGGHSDLIAGALVIGKKDDALVSRMANIVNSLGPITGAFDSYLILRSLKTLAVRMERHCENALAIAKHFESHKEISEVIYPGLSNHPQHDLASKQMKGFGGIISMNIKGGLEKSKSFLERTEIFALAESLGGVESLIEHPALMTHASLPKDRREMIGISDGLVRLSVGLESLDDLLEDIEQALK
jgi:cystathionine gamma-lyase